MFYVYIIRSQQTNELYIGYSADLKRRIIEHNTDKSFSTKNKGPWKLIYYEAYSAQTDAIKRERQLKIHGKAMGQLKRRLAVSLKIKR
jgi:putative endonuclease